VLEKALKGGGMLPQAFDAAEPRWRRCATTRPDVLMTDIRMPGRSGLDLLRRNSGRAPGAAGHRHDRALGSWMRGAAYQGGAFEYLPKPFDIDKAVDLVRRAAQQSTVSAT
jgi:two-component system, NtrC family, nitrogen regulation response regulator GlnG